MPLETNNPTVGHTRPNHTNNNTNNNEKDSHDTLMTNEMNNY